VSCPGVTIHCAGCAGGVAVPVVPLLELYGAMWLAEHIIEVAIACAVSGALAVAIVIALARWADRRDARRAAAWEPRYLRAVPAASTPQSAEIPHYGVPADERQAIAPTFVLNFYGADSDTAARVIRQAIPGQAGDAITEGK